MYDFDRPLQRRGTNCVKWDSVPDGVIPMWGADMDCETAPCVKKAVMERAAHGAYGYTHVPDSYFQSVSNWFTGRHSWRPDPSWILYTSGVVPAISSCISAFTSPGDKVIIMTPVYNCFFSSIRNWGCAAADVPLVSCGEPLRPHYEIDFEGLEAAAKDPKAKLMLICSPHNPAGRVWTREELRRVGEICLRNGVIPVSDEIHCEFVMPGAEFVPFASVSKEFESKSVILNSASKAFNIAGLQIANIICADPQMRSRIDKALNVNEICDVNPFGVVALQAAYTEEGEKWLKELNQYIADNFKLLDETCRRLLPDFPLYKLEGTYLAWLDCKKVCYNPDGSLRMGSAALEESLRDNEKVLLNAGSMYGSEGFLRINLACPRALLEEGLKRMFSGLNRF